MLAGVVLATIIAVQERIIGRKRGKFARNGYIGGTIKSSRRAIGARVTAVTTRWVLKTQECTDSMVTAIAIFRATQTDHIGWE